MRLPIFGTAMSALILGEVPSSALLSGGLLVILGLVLIERCERQLKARHDAYSPPEGRQRLVVRGYPTL